MEFPAGGEVAGLSLYEELTARRHDAVRGLGLWTDLDAEDPWAVEEQALAAESPAVLPNYDELSLAQLRARLRTLTAEDLEELLAHERTHAARPEFTGMLTRRIANLKTQ